MASNSVKTKIQSGVLEVILNRPEKRNAFDADTISEMTRVFKDIPNKLDILRAVLLRGEGENFCAGADLNWMKSMVDFSFEENKADSVQLYEMFEAIWKCPLPVVGRIHGGVFGGGVGLVACCDIVFAERDTKFCFSEVKLGLIPSVISSFVVPKIGVSHARRWMVTGDVFGAEEALAMGLVHSVLSNEDLISETKTQIENLKGAAPEAINQTKNLIDLFHSPSVNIKEETTTIIAKKRVSEEGQEGMRSFLEKSKPSWKTNPL